MAYSEIDGRRNAGCYFFENVGPRAHNYSYLISTCVSAFTLGLCLINITTPKSSKKKKKQFFFFPLVFAIFISRSGRKLLCLQNVLAF